jgi:hypothetical protein
MLQALYVDVAKVDRDVAHVVMAIHVCFKCISKMFHLFQMNVAIGLFGCCKSGSRCYIYMHVASICFKYFQVFHTYICKCFIWMLHMFAMVFKCFSGAFASVSCAFFYVATVASRCFKSTFWVLHMGYVWEAAGGADSVRAAWATSKAARAHYWCAHLQVRRARRSLALYASSVWTLALGSDVPVLVILYMHV